MSTPVFIRTHCYGRTEEERTHQYRHITYLGSFSVPRARIYAYISTPTHWSQTANAQDTNTEMASCRVILLILPVILFLVVLVKYELLKRTGVHPVAPCRILLNPAVSVPL